MPDLGTHFGTIGGLIIVAVVAAMLIRRASKRLRGELAGTAEAPIQVLTPDEVAAITSQGLATAEQVFVMDAKEQRMLAATAIVMRNAKLRRSQAVAVVAEREAAAAGAAQTQRRTRAQ